MAIHTGKPTTAAQGGPGPEEPSAIGAAGSGERHRLTALQGLAALSLDAMASAALNAARTCFPDQTSASA